MKLKDLIPLGIIGALLFVPKVNNNNIGTETPPAAYGGVEKTKETSVVDSAGRTFKVEVGKDSTIKYSQTDLGTPKIYEYRADGTLKAEYTAPTKTWKDIEKEQKEIIEKTGSPIKQTITYKTDSGTKTGGYITYVDTKTGKTKMVSEGQYSALKNSGKV